MSAQQQRKSSQAPAPSAASAAVDPFADDVSSEQLEDEQDADISADVAGTGENGGSSPAEGTEGGAEGGETDAEPPVDLNDSWRFFREKPLVKPGEGRNQDAINKKLEDKERIKALASFHTLQGFWRAFKGGVGNLGILEGKEFFHMMKKIDEKHIQPMWEDEYNANGGEWLFRIAKDKAEQVWQDLLLMTIGGQLDDVLAEGDEICGVSASPRAVDFVFQVWTKSDKNEKLMERIKANIPEGIEVLQAFYRSHKTQLSGPSTPGK